MNPAQTVRILEFVYEGTGMRQEDLEIFAKPHFAREGVKWEQVTLEIIEAVAGGTTRYRFHALKP